MPKAPGESTLTTPSYPRYASDLSAPTKKERDEIKIRQLINAAYLLAPSLKVRLESLKSLTNVNAGDLERLQKNQFKWLLKTVEATSAKLDYLIDNLPPEQQPEAADIAAHLEAAMKVSTKTGSYKKRKLLKNALINSFDPKLYEEGMSIRLFSILEKVEYGEVEMLESYAPPFEGRKIGIGTPKSSIDLYHIKNLRDLNLLYSNNERIADGTTWVAITDLGNKFLEFIKDVDEEPVDVESNSESEQLASEEPS